jgi:hypothetical protein
MRREYPIGTESTEMLPDLPELKRELQRIIDQYLQRQIRARMGVFEESPRHIIHEGERMRIVRADGSVDESNLQQSTAEMTIKMEEIPTLTIEDRIRRLDGMAEDMAKQISEHLFGTLNETLEKAGQVVDAKGKPFDAEVLFGALSSVQLEFDDSGQHHGLQMVIPPAMAERVRAVFAQIDADPMLKRQHEELIGRKFGEWRDREAARKLVG